MAAILRSTLGFLARINRQMRVKVYRGFYEPPTEEEYLRLVEEYGHADESDEESESDSYREYNESDEEYDSEKW